MIYSFGVFEEDAQYRFLSNFYPCVISDPQGYKENKETTYFNWPSAEHYYQSLKTTDIAEKGDNKWK